MSDLLDSLQTIEKTDDAVDMFDGYEYEIGLHTRGCMLKLIERGSQSEWAAFVIFQTFEIWKIEQVSERKMFTRDFGRTKSTLYRWKRKLGSLDRSHASKISHGIEIARNRNKLTECPTMGHQINDYQNPCADYMDTAEPFSLGDQLEFSYAEPLANGFERLGDRVLDLLREHGENKVVTERVCDFADRFAVWTRTQATGRQHGRYGPEDRSEQAQRAGLSPLGADS